eukprot:CAMPEP_0113648082 /NCGR_PEP_ID=MMETSP0017_2-20120614/25485_1 /TAXON_ID=2856 /ORGANISM="Cylindrotheca closterium" /LENGTH=507 /DNA_ID=CAMNT_0000560243 /DNA_START=144 /DNA_END=1667 /DNA_ORIENTATION=+ /assembly_acc=CAM_ASM_000147
MKFISTLFLFAASLAVSAKAEDSMSTLSDRAVEFAGCLNFYDDGSWIQVPDFESRVEFLATLESPFQYSAESNHTNQAVRVQPAGELVSDDYGWTLGVFDTAPPRDERIRPGRMFDIFNPNSPKHEAWYKNENGKFAVTWNSTSSDGTAHNSYQIVLSNTTMSDMGDGNNICFCYGVMQWGEGKVNVQSSGTSDHAHVDYYGGTFDNQNVHALDHKTCCFSADKLKELGQNQDFLSLCNARPTMEAGSNGDPHFKTWQNEHFEYHGQCDLVLTKNPDFANGLGIDVHIRTKLVRYWSYIKNAVIRIGNDVLEIEGSGIEFDPETHYWINFEFQGELTEFAGFPVKMFSQQGTAVTKNRIEIDLDSVYPGQKIVLSTYKEFVKVSFENASEESFGKSVGMLGDFNTGKTLARDGVTMLNDFTDLGHEWQVLPSDKHLFREVSAPQFPDGCIDPEDPRGERRRRRRLDGSLVSEEEAEAACAGLHDELDRKDCVYDILATQDLDMAGAY